MAQIVTTGDPINQIRQQLAAGLSLKNAQPRYEAFLRRVPAFISDAAKQAPLERAPIFLQAYEDAGNLLARAFIQNTDKSAAVLEMGRILASLHQRRS